MGTPFSRAEFFGGFRDYNTAIFPGQALAYALCLAAVYFALRGREGSGRNATLILGVLWLWNGLTYHLMFFSAINPAAIVFAVFFIIQALLFLREGLILRRLDFVFGLDRDGLAGAALIVYAGLVYPLIGQFAGHGWPALPLLGTAPCPTTIFTLGLLLWTTHRLPLYLWIIVLAWSFIGTWAAVEYGVWQDYAMPVAGIAAGWLLLRRRR
jgi:hypothetical protein